MAENCSKLRSDMILSNVIVFWIVSGWECIDFKSAKLNIVIEIIESGIFYAFLWYYNALR